MTPEELDDLLLGHLEGRLTREEDRALEEALRADPEAGRRFAELALQEHLLREMAETEEIQAAAAPERGGSTARIRRVRAARLRRGGAGAGGWIWAAAAAAFLLFLGLSAGLDRPTRRPPKPAPAPEVAQAEPENPAPPPRPTPPRTQPPADAEPPPIPRVAEEVEVVAPDPPLPTAPKPDPAPEPRADPSPPPAPPPPPKPAPAPAEPPPQPPAPPTRTLPVPVATIARLEGAVEVVGPAGRSRAHAGRVLVTGESVETAGAQSYATLRLPDGTRIELDPGSCLSGLAAGAAKAAHLERGRLYAAVTRQPSGQSIVFTTSLAAARVLGTRLFLSAEPGATRLEVTEGRVRLVRRADGASVDVTADHYALVSAGPALAARPLPALFQDGFDASPLNEWPRGWLKHQTEPANRSGFAVLEERGRPRERFAGCSSVLGGTTQHAVLPLADWPSSFAVSFRMRLTGNRSDRAGIEIDDGRQDQSFQYDAQASAVEMDWPRNTATRQAPLRLAPGVWSEWTVSVDGTRFRVVVDRKPLLDADIPNYGRVRGASLVTRGADPAQFDDVKVVRR